MNVIPIAAAALLMFQAAGAAPKPAAAKPAAAKATTIDVGVTVSYKGKGTVDAGHKVIVRVDGSA